MSTKSLSLWEPVQAHRALAELWIQIKAELMAGHRLRVSVKTETRRDSQNAHFHSLISQISEAIGGDLANADDAKRILLSAFKIDTLHDEVLKLEWSKFGEMRIGRGLRGETVLLGNQTRDLSVKLAAAFITWLEVFGADHGVRFKAPRSWEGMER